MGSCVSSHLRKGPAPGSTVADVPSPVEENAVNGGEALKSQWSFSQSKPAARCCGSKDDVFFDSRAWLDSDCDDDFFSVNGDFTPSRGSTPVHHSPMGAPRVSKTTTITIDEAPAPVSETEPSPYTKKKKKLAELFRDSIGGSEEAPVAAAGGDESKSSPEKKTLKPPKQSTRTILNILPCSRRRSPSFSRDNSLCNSEGALNGSDQEKKLERARATMVPPKPGVLQNLCG